MAENRFTVDYNSFVNELPCAEYVEALTDCRLNVFSKPDFLELSRTLAEWSPMITRIMASMNRTIFDAHQMLSTDASERYRTFLENNAGLANRIPLSVLASYFWDYAVFFEPDLQEYWKLNRKGRNFHAFYSLGETFMF